MNRLIKFFQGYLSLQLVTSVLGSISNFAILFFSVSLFTSNDDASEFLALYSLTIILSAFYSYVLIFRNGEPNKLIIDFSFIFITATMIFAAFILCPSNRIISIIFVVLMFIKEIYRFLGIKNKKNDEVVIKLIILILTLLTLLVLINNYFQIKLNNILILGFIFAIQLMPVMLFKLNKNNFLFSLKPYKSINLFFNAASEFMPIVAGYFVNVYSFELMSASDYVEYRRSYAVVGLSSLIGTISLILLLNNKEILTKNLSSLVVLMLASVLTSLFYMSSIYVIIIATVVIFSISSIINSYNKINLPRMHHFFLQAIPGILIVAYIVNSNNLIPIQLLLVLSAIQVFYFIVSCILIRLKNFSFKV